MRALWLTPGYPSSVDPVGFVFHQTQARALANPEVQGFLKTFPEAEIRRIRNLKE